ncbi:MAG: hypothetical protein ACNI3A_18590 [Desulfovibrio sp.]|uniref:hypothetical protein n=1 Tax=Desulfovibrio sp. 7SRBS1 TaxID=3378064 RepID=UPI003B3E5577
MNANIHAGVGAGRYRDPWGIRRFLDANGKTMTDVARTLDISSQAVSATVKGVRNNRRVLRLLRDMGCPAKALSLPDDLKEQEVA